MKSDPYEAVRNLCASLEAEGHSADIITDALLCTGLNAGNKLAGPEFVIAYLHKMIATFEAQAGKRAAPPTMTQ
jgi:hypothetical protein